MMTAAEEWRRGWRLVVASAAGMTLASIPVTSVGVYMETYQAQFGWSRAWIASAVAIITFTAACTAPLIGLLVKRYGLRRLAILGAVFAPITFALLAFSQGSIVQYAGTYFLIAAAHTVSSAYIWTIGVAQAFSRARGMAVAVVLMGSSAAGAAYPPIATLSMEAYGWRATILATGGISMVAVLAIVILWFRVPKATAEAVSEADSGVAQDFSFGEALRDVRLWLLILAVLLGCGPLMSMVMHCIPLLSWHGFSPIEAATGMLALGTASIFTKVLVGYLIDRTSVSRLSAVMISITLVPAFMLQMELGNQVWWPLIIGGMIGIAASSEIDLLANFAARHWSMGQFAIVYGIIFGAFQLSLGIGPIILGASYDATGSYGPALAMMPPMILISAVLFFAAGISGIKRS